MKSTIKLAILFIILSCIACSGTSTSYDTAEIQSAPEGDMAKGFEGSTAMPIERKIIRNGSLEFETFDLKVTRNTILQSARKYKALIEMDQEMKSPGRISNTLTVRVPGDNLDAFIAESTKGVTAFDIKEVHSQDVTREFVDVQARLKTKKELETRYLELLKQAKNVAEMIELEKHLGDLRAEIESIQGQLNFMQNQVSYSTLTITFYETVPTQRQFAQKFKNGFREGWDNMLLFFVFLTHVWPFIILVIATAYAVKIYKTRKK